LEISWYDVNCIDGTTDILWERGCGSIRKITEKSRSELIETM
jgi:hypothetical protein